MKLHTYYTGQDIAFQVDLKTVNYNDAQDIIVDVFNNERLVKTLRKTLTGGLQVLPVTGAPTRALVRVFVDEVATMVEGYVRTAITVVTADADFPNGKHDKYFGTIAKFEAI
jgi:hypothetical protein